MRAVALRHGLNPQQVWTWRRRAEGKPLEKSALPARMIVTVRACEGMPEQSQPADRSGTPAIEIAIWRHDGACAGRLVLVAKPGERGSLGWPTIGDGVMRLTPARLSALLKRLDWTGLRAMGVRASQAKR